MCCSSCIIQCCHNSRVHETIRQSSHFRYLKGIYNRYPVLPKYSNTWDISLLLKYYNSIDNNEKLQFKDLVEKTVVLFMILGARRKQALFSITVDNTVVEKNKIVFLPKTQILVDH